MSFVSTVNFTKLNLTLNDFEHPYLEALERYCLPGIFSVTVVIVCTFIYVALTQSPKTMKAYSYLLIWQVFTTFVMDVLTFFFQPVMLLPYAGGYINGYWKFDETWNPLVFLSYMLIIILCFQSMGIQILFRLGSLFDNDCFIHKFSNIKFLLGFTTPILFTLLGFVGCKLLGSLGFDQPEAAKFRKVLVSDYPFFQQVFNEHSGAMGYHPSYSSSVKIFFYGIIAISIFIPTFLIFFILPLFYQRLNYIKKNSQQTRKLHVMLLRALTAQIITMLIFELLPFEFFCIPLAYPFKEASLLASTSPLLVMLHTIADILVQFYFIKPYRNFILHCFGMLITKTNPRSATITSLVITQ